MDYTETIGTCTFCGQTRTIQTDAGMTKQEADEQATEMCQCIAAKDAVTRRTELAKGMDKLDELFGAGCEDEGGDPMPDVIMDMLRYLLQRRVDNVYRSITAKLGGGGNGRHRTRCQGIP